MSRKLLYCLIGGFAGSLLVFPAGVQQASRMQPFHEGVLANVVMFGFAFGGVFGGLMGIFIESLLKIMRPVNYPPNSEEKQLRECEQRDDGYSA